MACECGCVPLVSGDVRLLCGHRTLWFVLQHLGVDGATVAAKVDELAKQSFAYGGVVFPSQLLDKIASALKKTKSKWVATLHARGSPGERSLPLRTATVQSGWRHETKNRPTGTQTLANRELQLVGRSPLGGDASRKLFQMQQLETEKLSSASCNNRVTTKTLKQTLLNGGQVVMLIDSRFLPFSSAAEKQSTTYRGHFITLHNYHPPTDQFQIYDSRFTTFQHLSTPQLNKTRRLSTMVWAASTILIKPKPQKRKFKQISRSCDPNETPHHHKRPNHP